MYMVDDRCVTSLWKLCNWQTWFKLCFKCRIPLFCADLYYYVPSNLMIMLQVTTMTELLLYNGKFCLSVDVSDGNKTLDIDGIQIKLHIWYVCT